MTAPNRLRGLPFMNAVGGITTGAIFWVNSATGVDSPSYGSDPDTPFATVDYAIGKCTASAGDVIYIMPGHSESTTASNFTLDVAGVSIIGLGRGSLRPTFTFSATDSIITVSAANCLIENIVCNGNVDNIVTGISLSATATNCVLKDIVMNDGATNKEFLIGIAVAADCDDLTIDGLRFNGLGGGATGCIEFAGGSDRAVIKNCYINGKFSSQTIDLSQAASTDLQIFNNAVINIETGAGLGIAMHNSSNGFCHHNVVTNLKDTVVGVTGTGMAYAENYCSNAVNASGIIKPAVDS